MQISLVIDQKMMGIDEVVIWKRVEMEGRQALMVG